MIIILPDWLEELQKGSSIILVKRYHLAAIAPHRFSDIILNNCQHWLMYLQRYSIKL